MTTEPVTCPQSTRELETWYARAARVVLFLYSACVLCPIRFWPIADRADNTWVFASNCAAARGLANGRDIFWTSGPLGYLAFPQDLGNNLVHALTFQVAVWGVLILAVADMFLIARFPLRNAALFVVFLGLSGPLYWFNYMGLENLLLAGALLLMTVYRWHEGRVRYLTALVMIGIIPLIKLTGGMLAAGALAGFLIDRALNLRWKVAGDALLAVFVPPLVAGGIACIVLWPFDVGKFLKVSFELVRGYSLAMSLAGPNLELVACFEVLALIGAVLWWQHRRSPFSARFNFLLLAIPLALSIKHGFVRQDDVHIVIFFCFAALALGLIFLSFPLPRGGGLAALMVLAVFGVLWQHNATASNVISTVAMASGVRQISFVCKAARGVGYLRSNLRSASQTYYMTKRMERNLREAIGDADMASLSVVYSWAAMDGLRLKLYPIVQRYSAYTLYLDSLNADWIRNRGPRFLIFDGQTIDARNMLAETPAMWLEVYRWYDTRLLGPRNLLLERRTQPRFESLQPVARGRGRLYDELPIPAMEGPVFLTMKCSLSRTGKLASQLLSVPEVRISLSQSGHVRSSRVIPEVLIAPTLVNYAPSTLPELAMLFQKDAQLPAAALVTKIAFEGPGLSYYDPNFEFELYRETKPEEGFGPGR